MATHPTHTAAHADTKDSVQPLVGSVITSQSQADGATTLSGSIAFSPADVCICSNTNGGTPPNQSNQVVLLLSWDNVTFTAVDRRTFGLAPNQIYVQSFELADYLGSRATPEVATRLNKAGPPTNYKVQFGGNVGAAVTILATDQFG